VTLGAEVPSDANDSTMASPRAVLSVVFAGVAVALVGSMIALSSIGASDDTDLTGPQEFSLAVPWLLALGGAGLVAGGLGGRDPRDSLGLRRPALSTIAFGVAGGLLLQVVVVAVDNWLIEPIFGIDVGAAGRELSEGFAGSERVLLVMLVAVIGPVAEELLFRGALQGTLSTIWANPRPLIMTTIIFALSHFQPAQFASLLIVGAMLGFLVQWRQSLWASIACHVTFNVSGLVFLL
jgi:membrane protease YdiL (CAAX protease family)